MSEITRREFIRRSLILSAGASLIISCEDNENYPSNSISNSPGMLSSNGNAQKIIVIGAGMSGLVAAYELVRAGHDVTILEARDRIGGRVLTIRSPFSNNHFAEGGAARIKPSHNLTIGYANHFNLNLYTAGCETRTANRTTTASGQTEVARWHAPRAVRTACTRPPSSCTPETQTVGRRTASQSRPR